ncbi:MAG TPA: DUF2934 domain-containing protein [Candidatus Dormibacteraeota bacterium]|nr:DUF2934 domain-containing protein [Candidatus Dormibacteraeota bacterium]
MARSKSTPGTKASRTGTDASTSNSNKEQANSVTPANIPEVKSAGVKAAEVKSVAEDTPVVQSETKPQNKVVPTTRRLEVAKPEPRKNVVPINLEDEIRRRAYELYEQRGNSTGGSEAEDWLTAESEVRQRYHQRSA